MKRIFYISIILVLILSASANAKIMTNNSEKNNTKINTYDFTHTVLVEFCGTSNCGHCPTANSQLNSIYNSGEYDFVYLSMVVNENYIIYDRVKELGVKSVPHVFFDGKFENLLGAQENTQSYIDKIQASGEREVPNIDISIDAEWKSQATIKIKVDVINNEEEDYNGFLRVYIVESDSRWTDAQRNIFHFGVLDIPMEKPLTVSKQKTKTIGETYTFKTTWIGALYGFNDIEKNNIKIVASLFDKKTDHAVNTEITAPNTKSINKIIDKHNYFQIQSEFLSHIKEILLSLFP